MAVTKSEAQVLWATAATKSLNSASRFDSDAVTVADGDFLVQLQMVADSSSTPGEDPAARTLDISNIVVGVKSWKVSAVAAQGASRAITFSARYSKLTQS